MKRTTEGDTRALGTEPIDPAGSAPTVANPKELDIPLMQERCTDGHPLDKGASPCLGVRSAEPPSPPGSQNPAFVDVPVQFFQSVIAIELAVAGALLWQMRFFAPRDATRRESEGLPDSRLRL